MILLYSVASVTGIWLFILWFDIWAARDKKKRAKVIKMHQEYEPLEDVV